MLGGFAMNNKLQGKDLINIGIFTAYLFYRSFSLRLHRFYPDFHSAYQRGRAACGRYSDDVVLLQIKKFGMLTICGVLLGIIMLLTGMGWWCILPG